MIRLTREQIREVDRVAVERYGIPGIVLMENAARGAAAVAETMMSASGFASVLIVCGGGNNGGDGLAMARHLHNREFQVTVLLATDPNTLRGDAAINWRIVEAMKLPCRPATPDGVAREPGDLIVDALFGTGLTSAPRAAEAALILTMNQRSDPVLAVDVPSGLDCDRGEPLGACVRAAKTVTFVAEKIGFERPRAKHFLGDVAIVDIGVPQELVEEVSRS